MEQLLRQPPWTFPLAKLKQISPSHRDGISFDNELLLQSKAASFIVQAGAMLHLPALTIFTAVTFVHRFYVRRSLRRVHHYEAAAACVFLASKTEETPRRLREVAAVCARIAAKKALHEPQSDAEVAKWIDSILYTEELLLEGLFFDFEVESPYATISRVTQLYGVSRVDNFAQMATTFVNDSCRTMLIVLHPASVVATAAVYWASKYLRVPIADVDGQKWYVKEGLSRRQLIDVVNTMADMMAVVRNGKIDGQVYDRIQ